MFRLPIRTLRKYLLLPQGCAVSSRRDINGIPAISFLSKDHDLLSALLSGVCTIFAREADRVRLTPAVDFRRMSPMVEDRLIFPSLFQGSSGCANCKLRRCGLEGWECIEIWFGAMMMGFSDNSLLFISLLPYFLSWGVRAALRICQPINSSWAACRLCTRRDL
eukprot:gene25700-biopygen10771